MYICVWLTLQRNGQLLDRAKIEANFLSEELILRFGPYPDVTHLKVSTNGAAYHTSTLNRVSPPPMTGHNCPYIYAAMKYAHVNVLHLFIPVERRHTAISILFQNPTAIVLRRPKSKPIFPFNHSRRKR